jgi:hypothetical protein
MIKERTVWTICSALALAGASMAGADAPIVQCNGLTCGGTGGNPTYPVHFWGFSYYYEIDAVSYPMMEFRVGTNDLDIDHYANVTRPEGWHFAVEPIGMSQACGLFTEHGDISTMPCFGLTAGSVRWWTDDPNNAIETFEFGFTHAHPPIDVGWTLTTRREMPGEPPQEYVFTPFWDAPVGIEMGPLHGPSADNICFGNDGCDPFHYCLLDDCDAESGICVLRPVLCPNYWHPVCGCDGVTYSNGCYAAREGVNVAHDGPCSCTGDFDENGFIDVADLFFVLQHWGPCPDPPAPCPGDVYGFDGGPDGRVNVVDFFWLLHHWGPCPLTPMPI